MGSNFEGDEDIVKTQDILKIEMCFMTQFVILKRKSYDDLLDSDEDLLTIILQPRINTRRKRTRRNSDSSWVVTLLMLKSTKSYFHHQWFRKFTWLENLLMTCRGS